MRVRSEPLAAFHPAVAEWFEETLGEPTPPQAQGWPLIRDGRHTLIAAPTGTGKTLAAFLWVLDGLLRQGTALPDATQVLYVSPLRALSYDVQKNLTRPLEAIRARDASLPELRVLVRTGDTTASARAAMGRRPPHVLVTTPESLYILLTSDGGRRMLSTVRTVIVDEIHALARDKRGSHLALSLERLEALTGPSLQRIGLSATQKPLERVSQLLVGADRECRLVDAGHLRAMDLDVVVPDTPLSAVCSHDQWGEIYTKMTELIREHRTTLIFVNTRKLAERLAARLSEQLGADKVGCHHGSLSKETRHEAEQRLKQGELSALVATASLELGIDIGDVDLALQVGSSRSIATLLQRVGRAGHGVDRRPKGRLFPLTLDEAVEALALLSAVRRQALDITPEPPLALDILAQQTVAACVAHEWEEDALYAAMRRAGPYRELLREDFDACVALHSQGRGALLHRDGVNGRLMAARRARLPALTSGGAIPDNADYQVLLEPEGTFVGTLNEDFAIEANRGDIFQLGNTSWRILRVEPGIVRVADAAGQPPTLPFWIGEAPSRTAELSDEIGNLREGCAAAMGCPAAAPDLAAGAAFLREQTAVDGGAGVADEVAAQIAAFIADGATALGAVPTQRRIVLERFFDESGGMQLVVHSPFGGRINRAWGLALRKRFCRGFGFELQAAANEEAIVISLGAHHSFPIESVFGFLHSKSARDVLVQALLAAPMFTTRWRWNAMRSLMLPRLRNGRRVPPALARMRAEDLLAAAFPQAIACFETLPPGDIPVPTEHPMVRQTVDDCLHEAMDVDGLLALLTGLEQGTIEQHARDTSVPSAFAHGILSAQPYSFLDDAPLEERRTQAVMTRRTLDPAAADSLGALDPDAIARVRDQAWPEPQGLEELHEALLWMGFLTQSEAVRCGWTTWLAELERGGRAEAVASPAAAAGPEGGRRWFATEAPREGRQVLAGRLEALGPVDADDPLITGLCDEILQLESEGAVLRTRVDGRAAWCNRRLLARIHRETLERLRREIEPVSAGDFLRFLARWQFADTEARQEGPRGVLAVVHRLAGWQAPAAAWERHILPARVAGYRPAWLDELVLSGEVAWGRLWGAGAGPIRGTPIAIFPRDQAETWQRLAGPGDSWSVAGGARPVHETLTARGACFPQELLRHAGLLPAQLEQALSDLVGLGLASCDSFAGLRVLLARRRRAGPPVASGRWTTFRSSVPEAAADGPSPAEFAAQRLLARTGVVFRRTIERERLPVPWRDLLRAMRAMESRGDVRGGRFVAGFSGEQYALPEAVEALRAVRRGRKAAEAEDGSGPAGAGPARPPVMVVASDPLNFAGILTPDERVASTARTTVRVA
ncbi:MAG: DEAD/DEAH box helicase [Planctomycetota bacterium]|jgi:ATP-dependent Lhr-like helicase